MRHRNFILLLLLLSVYVNVSAQTQIGYVKTRGRIVNGKLQRGHGLPGATVGIQGGNSYSVQNTDGSFSFLVPSQTFEVKSVQKNGYQLVDADALNKSYQYNKNPLYLVMETPEQQRSDLLAAERKVRCNLQRLLQQRENEIDALNASNETKDSLLQILYQQQSDNERLIADMAKRYSSLDYDQMDEFYIKVNNYIENGELIRADSLLRTRGDINSQVLTINKQGQTIIIKETELTQAKAVHQADIEEAARRCYSYYESFKLKQQNDSAAHYLELRTSLDSTNIEWLRETGLFISEYISRKDKAYYYLDKAFELSNKIHGRNHLITASILVDFAKCLVDGNQCSASLNCISMASSIIDSLGINNYSLWIDMYTICGDAYLNYEHENLLDAVGNIGHEKLDSIAINYYLNAIDLLGETNSADERIANVFLKIAHFYNNYRHDNDSTRSYVMDYLSQAYEFAKYHNLQETKLMAQIQEELSRYYEDVEERYDLAIGALEESKDIYTKIYGWRHPKVLYALGNIGRIYNRFNKPHYAVSIADTILCKYGESSIGKSWIKYLYEGIAMIFYYDTKEYSEALKYYSLLRDMYNPTDIESSVLLIVNVVKWNEEIIMSAMKIGCINVARDAYTISADVVQKLKEEYMRPLLTPSESKFDIVGLKEEYKVLPKTLREKYLQNLCSLCNSAFYMKRYDDVKKYSQEAFEVDSTIDITHKIQIIYALSLTLQNKKKEAEMVYLKNRKWISWTIDNYIYKAVIPTEYINEIQDIKKTFGNMPQ